ncbi:uncharacterized protein [Venturia canescens]|nr:uncharacterized protein LOC122409939 isoform X2 [Venturia canescens]
MMEIMEDGNLVDRVRILLQRDMQYYQSMQTVLRESLCVRVCGGELDFPRHASFAAIKIVIWWEAEFLDAFRRPSGLSISTDDGNPSEAEAAIKKTPPSEFILLVVDTSKQFLEHLHTLIQESLDHADLTVLTATLGAAALIRNCLWCYTRNSKNEIPSQTSAQLSACYKSYNEMTEAVAGRLLDLHCRLIALYILMEADSLSWQKNKPFFEKERCTFVIQMWWLYMQGTKADLWNTVSPKMARRIFSGVLNESLTILVTRFIHGRPSLARSEQYWADAFNVLSCSAYLTLSASLNADELIGLRVKKLPIVMRDIHAKCGELLLSLVLRGTPLHLLYQVCRNGLENTALLGERGTFAPWLLVAAPNLLGNTLPYEDYGTSKLSPRAQVILELNVLRAQPQANWTYLLKVFSMNDCAVARMLLSNLVRKCTGYTEIQGSMVLMKNKNKEQKDESKEGCGGFLCTGAACKPSINVNGCSDPLCLYSLMYITVNTFMDPLNVVIPSLKQDANWPNYLDRQQVWNQARPPWLHALLAPIQPMITPIVETLLDAVKTGASVYQAMSLALACFEELFICVPIGVLATCFSINENLPAHCHPLGGSVLLQVLCASLYTALLEVSIAEEKKEASSKEKSSRPPAESGPEGISFDTQNRGASATALAEAICSIDEDNKHTNQIDDLIELIENWIKSNERDDLEKKIENTPWYIEKFTNQILLTPIGRRSMKVALEYLIRASDWVLNKLKQKEPSNSVDFNDTTDVYVASKPLTYVMFHIDDAAFDQFLIDFDETHWQAILKTPIGGTLERVRGQILVRPEFKNLSELSHDEKEVATSMKLLCSIGRSPRF